jgi:hypothetical protein
MGTNLNDPKPFRRLYPVQEAITPIFGTGLQEKRLYKPDFLIPNMTGYSYTRNNKKKEPSIKTLPKSSRRQLLLGKAPHGCWLGLGSRAVNSKTARRNLKLVNLP